MWAARDEALGDVAPGGAEVRRDEGGLETQRRCQGTLPPGGLMAAFSGLGCATVARVGGVLCMRVCLGPASRL